MTYGLYQGLNEAYDAYRGREAQIKADKAAETQALREEERYQREMEEAQYAKSRRGVQERAEDAQVTAAELGVKTAEQQYKEFMSPEAIAQRAETNRINLESLQRENRMGKTEEEWSKIKDKSIKGAEKYRGWKREFMRGKMSMEDLVEAFNSDDDDSNNIDPASVEGNEDTGWTVTYDDGQTQTFADKYAVAIELESLADPAFHQQYLLQVEKDKSDLLQAIEKNKGETREDLRKFRNDWEDNTRKSLDRLKGSIIKEGIVDFGTEGNKRIAAIMASVVNDVGQKAQYQGLSNAEVIDRMESMMNANADFKPENIRQRAEEIYEMLPDEIPGGKNKKGTKEYDAQIQRLMEEDFRAQTAQLRNQMLGSYFRSDPDSDLGYSIKPGYMNYGLQTPTSATGDASTSAGNLNPVPEDAREKVAEDYAESYVPTERDQKTNKALVDDRMRRFGMKQRKSGTKPKEVTAKQKKAITNDFERTFFKLGGAQQKAWYDQFGSYLRPADRKKAQAELRKSLSELGRNQQAEKLEAEEAARKREEGERIAVGEADYGVATP